MSWRDAPLVEEKESGALDYLGRQAGLTTRAALEGVHDVVAPFTNAVSWGMNKALQLTPIDYRFPEQSQNFSALLSKAGLPEPETFSERAGNFGGRFISSMGAGGPLTKVASIRAGLPTRVPGQPGVATTEELRSQATAAYNAAEQSGVTIARQSIGQLADNLKELARKAGFDADLHPRVAAALNRFTADAGNDISFEGAEILRRVMKNAADSIQPDERRIAQEILEGYDDYIAKLGTSDVVAGDPRRAAASIKAARDFYTRLRKSETVEELIEKARTNAPNFSASGFENALRTAFRQLANNPKRLRVFTAAEQAAIKAVAKGGPIGNVIRMLGKMAPTGAVSAGMSGGLGYAVGGPVGALMLPAAGLAARGLATKATIRNAGRASELMRGPGPLPPLQPVPMTRYGLPPAAGAVMSEEERKRRRLAAALYEDEE